MKFDAKVIRGGADIAILDIDAVDRDDALRQVAGQGLVLLSLRARAAWRTMPGRRAPRFPLALFSQELLALLRAGLAVVEALETLADKESRPEVARVLRRIVGLLYEGRPLSYAIEHGGAAIPPLYVATLRASERTGALEEALGRYIEYQGQVDRLRSHLVGASIYPAVLAVVGVLVTTFLMMYVVPRFSMVYADIGGELPWASRLLMGAGRFLGENRLAILGSAGACLAAAAYAARLGPVRAWCQRRVWKLPALGERLRLFYLSRVYRTLGMLLRGGLPVATALPMAGALLQTQMRAQLARAADHIGEGHAISLSMERCGLTTPVAARMMRVGERTGQMGEMMERIAGFYEEELARWIERFTKLFEPILMIVIGAMIGGIVVLMYLPIFDLAGNIQ
ncbi:type II secretion system protein [Massilia sp. WF1]|uniref:type II secretion system F family protein n=1 Tax=unclassified Massilia TaxID=2609279 RepID=UPI00064ABE20|nr:MULTISPECIES: type II secretion system F family protein [unclassified Massilia]ALK97525.1 type II secretion system protein [Massilia sp. WG5]KLU36019.1 type II secretion system protein [Massilia sp. WF1]